MAAFLGDLGKGDWGRGKGVCGRVGSLGWGGSCDLYSYVNVNNTIVGNDLEYNNIFG
jgi:hypothetical protein